MKVKFIRTFASAILLFSFLTESLEAFQTIDPPSDRFNYTIDFRPVYSYIHTTDRDGSIQTENTINLRSRAGFSVHFTDNLEFHSRAAVRLSSAQGVFRLRLDDHTGGSGTYPPGTTTFDQIMLRWQVNPTLRVSAGRLQARFPLEGFIPKGADRYYGANLSISHTDGVWFEWNATDSWRLHLIGSHNGRSGSTHAARSPLRFDESAASRFTLFSNLQHRNVDGRWAQREFSISLTPQNFYRDDELRDHIALSTRWMYRPSFSLGGEEYLIGGELGFIPVAPTPSDTGLEIAENRLTFGKSAISWQISAYANHLFERHRVGILYGQTDPHWLISSSFAPNVTMAEMRYRFTINSRLNYEFRFRLRDEIYKPENVDRTRKIFDFYTRFTVTI